MIGTATPKPAKGTAKREKAKQKRGQQVQDRAVYDAVTVRDRDRCRACGTYAGISAHRHHLRGRDYTTLEDVCLVCPQCHEKLHVRIGGVALKMSGNADFRGPRGVLSGLTVDTRINGIWYLETDR